MNSGVGCSGYGTPMRSCGQRTGGLINRNRSNGFQILQISLLQEECRTSLTENSNASFGFAGTIVQRCPEKQELIDQSHVRVSQIKAKKQTTQQTNRWKWSTITLGCVLSVSSIVIGNLLSALFLNIDVTVKRYSHLNWKLEGLIMTVVLQNKTVTVWTNRQQLCPIHEETPFKR